MRAVFSRRVRDLESGEHLVTLEGELDMATANGLSEWLIEISGSAVIVDLAEVTFMDSSGINALAVARGHIAEAGDRLIVTRPSPIVKRTLKIVGLAHWVEEWKPDWHATVRSSTVSTDGEEPLCDT